MNNKRRVVTNHYPEETTWVSLMKKNAAERDGVIDRVYDRVSDAQQVMCDATEKPRDSTFHMDGISSEVIDHFRTIACRCL